MKTICEEIGISAILRIEIEITLYKLDVAILGTLKSATSPDDSFMRKKYLSGYILVIHYGRKNKTDILYIWTL